ncbi:hypothetical protein ENFAE_14310 [Enterococcus faecalis]|nr:hypothetical protein ENFAE_14310 [Enterococcus faecalis]
MHMCFSTENKFAATFATPSITFVNNLAHVSPCWRSIKRFVLMMINIALLLLFSRTSSMFRTIGTSFCCVRTAFKLAIAHYSDSLIILRISAFTRTALGISISFRFAYSRNSFTDILSKDNSSLLVPASPAISISV